MLLGGSVGRAQLVPTRPTAVEVTARTYAPRPHVALRWNVEAQVISVGLSRRVKGEAAWPAETVLAKTATTFSDKMAAVGVVYEYRVRRVVTVGDKTEVHFGTVAAGYNVPLVTQRGRVILLVDATLATPAATGLAQLQRDLVGDGWAVLRHDVARLAVAPDDESAEGKAARIAEVAAVKQIIVSDYSADPANTRAVFIVGHLPVPFSGVIAPDGHDGSDGRENHIGAWPADVFYADVDGVWTDSEKNYTGSLARRHNVPGDGKFDQDAVPGKVELMLGRVDFADIAQIPSGVSESALLVQYLARDHAFRANADAFRNVPRRALVDDNFGVHQDFDTASGTYFYEPFAASGWRAGVQCFGSAATKAGQWVLGSDTPKVGEWNGDLSTASYLLAYGCGGGDYTDVSGVANFRDFANHDFRAVFTMLNGSFFGEWSAPDDLLRAPLAGTPGSLGLACMWAGRPQFHLPHFALGEPLGSDVRLTQNNSAGDWEPAGYFNQVQVALMGDPTLRLHSVSPVTALTATAASGSILLKWSAPKDAAALRYHVFRATSESGPFTQMTGIPATPLKPTGAPITVRAWRDKTVVAGEHYVYLVRAVKREVSASGSYYNLSTGAAAAADAAQ